jgi:hypothetical protein
MMPNDKTLWTLSTIISLVLLLILVNYWRVAMDHRGEQELDEPSQLTSQTDVDAALSRYATGIGLQDHREILKIPTGIYIQSLDFFDSTRVYYTGYIWMAFSAELPAPLSNWHTNCEQKHIPFVFPDRVNSGDDIEPQFAYEFLKDNDRVRVCGWYFEVTVRQNFNYTLYPFDNKTVRLRMWLRDLDKKVMLVPDLLAYAETGTGKHDIFGINEKIVMSSWERANTYFNYIHAVYKMNFGGDDIKSLNAQPELHYNFVIKRKLMNAMVEHLLGLLVVMILLFATLLVVSRDPKKIDRHGFNTTAVVGACSALFFVVLISHIQIRSQFGGTSIVYLEYYYYLTYFLLIGTTVNTYLFSEDSSRLTWLLHYRDNILPKVAYWPFIFLYAVIVTHLVLQVPASR